jgi:hypothetical protein
VFILEQWHGSLVYTLCFALHSNTYNTMLMVQLTFPNFNYWNNIPNFFSRTAVWKAQCVCHVW